MDNFVKVEEIVNGYTGLFVGPQDWCTQQAYELGFTLDSAEELVRKRLELGPYHQISWTGSRLTDSLIYADGEYFLLKQGLDSPLYDPIAQSFHALEEEMPFFGTVDEALSLGTQSFDIPAKKLASHPISAYLLGQHAEAFGQWLLAIGIDQLPFHLPPMSLAKHAQEAFVRPLVMRCTDNWSGIVAQNDLHHAYGVRASATHLTFQAEPFLEAKESFSPSTLSPIAATFGLEPRAYTLEELQARAEASGLSHVLGLGLRLVRQGNPLPVSHATFAPQE